jgi:hypothetical protein
MARSPLSSTPPPDPTFRATRRACRIADVDAAKQLGKALVWDMRAGSGGVTAEASPWPTGSDFAGTFDHLRALAERAFHPRWWSVPDTVLDAAGNVSFAQGTDPDAALPSGKYTPVSEAGGFLHSNNWRPRVRDRAVQRARIERATPDDGRHTHAWLLIHAGRSPLLVSAAVGHASGETTWRRDPHVFDEARRAPDVSMVDAIEAARAGSCRRELRRGY